ncbi:MAG: restriction endonuclease subunit S, partial [Candidatus Methylumidiphilus sp.]
MNPTQLLQHFDRISEAPDAIPRLRRFILDLAVRGKLVEQDPNDEPAAELIKRIQAEKSRLVKEGKVKKRQELPIIDEGEEPFTIPNNWVFTRLGEIGDWGSGSTPPRGNSEYYGGNITWLKSGELGDNISLVGSEERITEIALEKCSFRLNKPGDVLIAMYGATIGKLAILAEYAATNQAVCGCTPVTGVLNKYLFIFLLSRRSDFHGQSEGGAQPNISREKIVLSPFALPPTAEQHRIVTKVDELMALCDQLEATKAEREQSRDRLAAASLKHLNDLGQSRHGGVTNKAEQRVIPAGKRVSSATDGKLQTIHGDWIPAIPAGMTDGEGIAFFLNHLPRITTRPAHIKQLRQTILNLAVRGKLVAQDSNDEPTAELIKRIQADKEKLGLTPRCKAAKEENDIEQEIPLYLPKGWQLVRFVDYALDISTGPFGSALHQSDYILDGLPLVNPSHMVNDRIIPDRKITISEDTANRLATYRMRAGDIVMARRGEVGRAAIVSMVEEGWLCGTGSFFVRFNKEISREYILLLLRSDSVRKY